MECLVFGQASRLIFGDPSLGVGRVRVPLLPRDDNDARTVRCVCRNVRDKLYNGLYV